MYLQTIRDRTLIYTHGVCVYGAARTLTRLTMSTGYMSAISAATDTDDDAEHFTLRIF